MSNNDIDPTIHEKNKKYFDQVLNYEEVYSIEDYGNFYMIQSCIKTNVYLNKSIKHNRVRVSFHLVIKKKSLLWKKMI